MPDTRIKTRRKKALIARIGHCINCGSTEELTIDHILARALGGKDNEANWQVYCFKCNNKKSAQESELARIRYTNLTLADVHTLKDISAYYKYRPLKEYESKHIVFILKYLLEQHKKKTLSSPIPKLPRHRRSMRHRYNSTSGSIHALMHELSRRGIYTWWI